MNNRSQAELWEDMKSGRISFEEWLEAQNPDNVVFRPGETEPESPFVN